MTTLEKKLMKLFRQLIKAVHADCGRANCTFRVCVLAREAERLLAEREQ